MCICIAEFSDRFIGLTGSWDQLKVIIKEFKVYFSIGPKDDDGDYIVSHTNLLLCTHGNSFCVIYDYFDYYSKTLHLKFYKTCFLAKFCILKLSSCIAVLGLFLSKTTLNLSRIELLLILTD